MQTYNYRGSAVTLAQVLRPFMSYTLALSPSGKHLLALEYGYISITPTESIAEVKLFFLRTQISKTFMR